MATISVYNLKGQEVEKLELNPGIFDGAINKAAMHQVVTAYLANQRAGTASTKTRGEVRGGGKKPWKQKHTGRARAGSIISPLWRKGGVVFGPKPRDYYQDVPVKLKLVALKSALNAKLKDSELKVVDSLKLEKSKTREIVQILKALQAGENVLFIINGEDKNIVKAANNLPHVDVKDATALNVYSVLLHTQMVISKPALEKLCERLK
ncbi:MAG: 50S ribosomal protein L4 [Candidatus Omnitrophica bacterium]|nr:50S ribosomal protein L4 [Candidatus Omnitrophota bacterium]